VPKSPWYYGDGASLLLLLGLLVVTGMAMTLTYSPSLDGAYASVRTISERQVLGWLIRAVHYWSAGMMVVMVVFHLFRVLLVGGYKAPREGTWLIGVLLLFAVIVMSFTGYVLRWDERGLYAFNVALHMFSRVPLIGGYLVQFVQGGESLGAQTLTRIYAVHVIFVPLLLLGLVGYHLYLVVVQGITSRAERSRPVHSAAEQRKLYEEEVNSSERGETFYPETAFSSGKLALLVFAGVAVLALLTGPPSLYPEANRTDPSFPIEEWWFWWYSSLIALLPSWLAPAFVVIFPILLFVALVILPFVDRNPHRGIRKRPVVAIVVALSVLILLGLTNLRYYSPWTGWPDPTPPPVPPGETVTEEVEEGRLLFARFGCNSCHPVGGHGWRVAIDLSDMDRRLSVAELRNFILSPPPEVPMPSYEGRLTEEELERIVSFVLVAQTWPRR
jgi:ubiquinol-cytochrome c reductase cytochrome b subunit